ncbi:competence/damage-inducible protein A [Leeia oryzae]|uniref:competence/damage-inducible protein A n=1 Tax=Leeia oryzae TaxID=356662 RepID=UPI00036CBBDC|nr:competence/damage-inducible protein A [Leeia oryzae]
MTIGAFIIGDEILSGRRKDAHMAKLIEMLAARGLELSWCHYLGDDRERQADAYRRSFATSDIVFSFGGIGATPDDHSRQAAAMALGVPLAMHPEGIKELEAQFGAEAWPNRVKMVEYPQGARIIPNPINRVPGFSVGTHHFVPGFPNMAWPMVEWVLNHDYPDLRAASKMTRSFLCHDARESVLLGLMETFVARFPEVRFSSLPHSIDPVNPKPPVIEFGVTGHAEAVETAVDWLRSELLKGGYRLD